MILLQKSAHNAMKYCIDFYNQQFKYFFLIRLHLFVSITFPLRQVLCKLQITFYLENDFLNNDHLLLSSISFNSKISCPTNFLFFEIVSSNFYEWWRFTVIWLYYLYATVLSTKALKILKIFCKEITLVTICNVIYCIPWKMFLMSLL